MPQRLANNTLLLGLLIVVFLLMAVFYAFLQYKEKQEVPAFLEKYMPQVEKTYYSVRDLL